MTTIDIKFDFLSLERVVLGIVYTKALMVTREEDEYGNIEEDESSANILTIGFFFFAINILIINQ